MNLSPPLVLAPRRSRRFAAHRRAFSPPVALAAAIWLGVVAAAGLAPAQAPTAPSTAPPPPLAASPQLDALQQQLEIQAAQLRLLQAELEALRAAPTASPPAASPPAVAPIRSSTPASPEFTAVLERLEALEEAQLTQPPPAVAAPKPSETAKPDDGWTDVSNEKWTVKLGGHVQLDYINWAKATPSIPGTQDYFEFRRLRLVADGTGYGTCDFRLQMTLEPETIGESGGFATSPDVKDAYFSMNEIPWLGRFRIGNFFVPYSLEQVTNDTNNIFLERSIPTQGVYAADREVGMALYNCTEDLSVSWATGIFFDSISETLKERIDDNQGYRVSGRLNWVPYYDEPSGGRYVIHTGIGCLFTDDHDNRVRFRARPQIREGPRIIDSGILAADSYASGNLELAIVYGRVTLQSEAFTSSTRMLNGTIVQTNGAYIHGSYFLTGENRVYERFGQHGAQFARNKPFNNFFVVPGAVSLGAIELKSRWSMLNLDDVDRGQYNDITVGFNWYWSDRTRVMFDWIHPYTTSEAVFGQTSSDILALRFDFNW